MRIDHVAMYCVDIEAMRDFFITYLGAECSHEYRNPRTGLTAYFMSFADGDTRLELMARPEITEARNGVFDSGYIHICINVGSREAVDSITERVRKDGFEIQSGPRVTGDGYYETCIFGPENVLVEITI